MKYLPLFVILLFIVSFTSACKKDENVEKQICPAGPGGNLELSFFVTHHDTLIPGAEIYVKFNATEFPGTDPANYDRVLLTGTAGHERGHAHLPFMTCGRYFIYSVGYDSLISDSVFGGIPVNITKTEGTETINVHVTE